MLFGNQLAMGIQSKNVRGLRVEPPIASVTSEAPHEPGFRGRSSLKKFMEPFFPKFFSLRNLMEFFLTIFYFLRIFSTKSTISQKIKIAKIKKLFLHRFQNIAHFLGHFLWPFSVTYFGQFFRYLVYKIDHFSKKIKSQKRKIVFHSFQNIAHIFGSKPILASFLGEVC